MLWAKKKRVNSELLYKSTMICQTQQNFITFIIVLGRHVSILIESSYRPF